MKKWPERAEIALLPATVSLLCQADFVLCR